MGSRTGTPSPWRFSPEPPALTSSPPRATASRNFTISTADSPTNATTTSRRRARTATPTPITSPGSTNCANNASPSSGEKSNAATSPFCKFLSLYFPFSLLVEISNNLFYFNFYFFFRSNFSFFFFLQGRCSCR